MASKSRTTEHEINRDLSFLCVHLSNPLFLSGWPCEGVLDEDELVDKTVVVDLAMARVIGR